MIADRVFVPWKQISSFLFCHEWKCPSAFYLFAWPQFMFYLSSPLISLGVQCFHLSLSNKEGVCSSFAFVTAASFPVADGSSVCASIPGTARNEQRCDMQELCQCLSLPLSGAFPTASLYRGNFWEKGKVESSNDTMQREQGFGAWLWEAPPPEGNSVKMANICQENRKGENRKCYFC